MSSKILTTPWPYIALLLAHLIWGANFVVAKVTLQEFPLYSLAFLRFALASLFLAPFFVIETKKIKVDKADLPKLILTGIFIITFNIAFFFAGIQKTSVSTAATLTLIIPIISVLIGWLFLKEKVFVINLIGLLSGLVGALIIVGLPQILLGIYDPQVLVGNVLIIIASISWVAGATLSKELLKKYSSLFITAFAFLVGTITFLPGAVKEYLANPIWVSQISSLGLLGLIYMTLLSSISAYFLFEWGLARTSLIFADLLQYIEPIIASILAVLVLNEHLSFPFIIGAALIILGVYWGTFAKERHHKSLRIHRH